MTLQSASRRTFVIGTASIGPGLALGLSFAGSAQAKPSAATQAMSAPEIGAWVVVQPNDTVSIRVVRSEMGQGTITGLAQLVAEELECDWSRVKVEYPTPGESLKRNRVWGAFSTGGSRGIRTSHDYVRKGGAAARIMLVQAAANRWKVPAAECAARKSLVTHMPSGRSFRFGELAAEAAKLPVPNEKSIVLKDPKTWTIIGKSVPRLDTLDKVTGAQVYGIDLQMKDMLTATITQCPVFGGKLKSFDASEAEKMPGVVRVVTVGDNAVAVVAKTFWQAKTAMEKVKIEWNKGPNANVQQADILKALEEGLTAPQAFVGNTQGDIASAAKGATKTIEATYLYPFLNHAPMEPMNATALYTPERCEAWVPTQDGEASFAAVMAASGLPAEKCDVHKVLLGGGFGRRGAFQDYVTQAVLIAKQLPGKPVKLIWTREEDMLHGHYHPIMMAKMKGHFDAQGKLTGVDMRLSGQSILAAVRPAIVEKAKGMDPLVFQGVAKDGEHGFGYTLPALKIDHAMRNTHVPPGFWRGVNINQNAIFFECFMDELADAAGMDPLAFRRQYLGKHPKNLAVLNAVAERIGWEKAPAQGVFRGICQMKGFGAYTAAACELSVRNGNQVKIHRIVAATDPIYAVNPAQIERQVSGSFVYGLSALFLQSCTVKNGQMEQTNFDTFGSMRIAQMPEVETIILQSGGEEWGGVGEPTIAVAAPAVLNALAKATGKRYRTVPLKDHGLQWV
jgi:isoquinoline 1-oxidoreductase subunit beta